MFSRKISSSIELKLALPSFAREIYALTDNNRDFLREWLPWLDYTHSEEDTRNFIKDELLKFARGESMGATIFYEGSIVGVAGFNSIDHTNGIGYIGYWLGEQFNGNGIMTKVVTDLIKIAAEDLSLQKVDIRCATGNMKSRAIPERLGFKHEGTLQRAEKLYDRWVDHEVYALLIK